VLHGAHLQLALPRRPGSDVSKPQCPGRHTSCCGSSRAGSSDISGVNAALWLLTSKHGEDLMWGQHTREQPCMQNGHNFYHPPTDLTPRQHWPHIRVMAWHGMTETFCDRCSGGCIAGAPRQCVPHKALHRLPLLHDIMRYHHHPYTIDL
jgi:hypothetical protein